MPLEPALLDYESTQMLIIGEDFEKGVQELSKDERDGDKEKPEDVLEKLEEEVSSQSRVFLGMSELSEFQTPFALLQVTFRCPTLCGGTGMKYLVVYIPGRKYNS